MPQKNPQNPEYVKHVLRPVSGTGTWCGARSIWESAFTGLDHVAAEGLREGRLLGCPECLSEAERVLSGRRFVRSFHGKEETQKP